VGNEGLEPPTRVEINRLRFTYQPCSAAVRRRWQFAHLISHFAISASNLSKATPFFTAVEMLNAFSPLT
jgi:hypothetical protein